MVANLAINADGKAAFISLRENPWHREGTVIPEAVPGREMLKIAGLDYQVAKAPLMATDPDTGDSIPVDDAVSLLRLDTKQSLGVVAPSYEVYQNAEIIDFFEGLSQSGEITYETAGALGRGESTWVLARIKDMEISINGDQILPYALIVNGHGNRPLCMYPTDVRVVCQNTMTWAFNKRKAQGKWGTLPGGYVIRHTKNMRQMVEQVQRAYAGVQESAGMMRDIYNFLASQPLTEEKKAEFFDFVIDPTKDESQRAEEMSANRKTRRENRLNSLEEVFESETNQQPGTRGTMYSALTTAIEFIDHTRATRCSEGEDPDSKRFTSSMFGSGASNKLLVTEKALALSV